MKSIWPIPELTAILLVIVLGDLICGIIIIGGEFNSFMNKGYSADLCAVMAWDITFNTDYTEKYVDICYPNTPLQKIGVRNLIK